MSGPDEMRREPQPGRQDPPAVLVSSELTDEELEAVVGGLSRAWTEPPRAETGRDA